MKKSDFKMMKKTVLSLVFFLMCMISNAQDYKKDWEKVYEHELADLTKSALQAVDKIYNKAKKRKNEEQLIKTLLYKSKFALTLEEEAQLKIIQRLDAEISSVSPKSQAVLQGVLAKLYWQYYQKNRWKINRRTKTDAKINADDFRTWDLQTLFSEIHLRLQKSLENKNVLQQTALTDFKELIDVLVDEEKYSPTLFDFLSQYALDFYKSSESRITQPKEPFIIDSEDFFTNFIDKKLETKDDQSLLFHGLKTYQNLMLYHQKDKDSTVFVLTSLEALQFIKQNSVLEYKEDLYLKALRQLSKAHKNAAVGTSVDFEIAKLFNEQGNTYQPNKNETHRFKKAKALALCKQAIKDFPKSIGAKNCKMLKRNILQDNLVIKAEKYVLPNQSSLFKVNYRNINHLYFKVYPIGLEELKKYRNNIHNDSLRAVYFGKLKAVKTWKPSLRNEKDYQNHDTEIVVPALAHGAYLVTASTSSDISNTDALLGVESIQVSNITLIRDQSDHDYVYQVLDRQTGKPIANAKIHLKNKGKSRYHKHIDRTLITDALGKAKYRSKHRYNNVVATVTAGKKQTQFGEYSMYELDSDLGYEHDDTTIQSFVFTDRSIYRPGQTMYFKTILIKKRGEKTDVYANKEITFTLLDVNDDEVKTVALTLNEFGTASGEIKLPETGLTGRYTFEIELEDDDDYDDFQDYIRTSIQVEEYKRPKFETEFEKVKTTIRLNDTVKVKGSATAFSGSKITDAKVVYKVKRKAKFPSWCYWAWRFRSGNTSDAQEITHGETLTDDEGNYTIPFKAIPDLSISKENQPTFIYEVSADVTDINGETHSTTTQVSVGYHTMNISALVSAKINKTDKKSIVSIDSKNLNGEFVPAKGIFKVYKLQANTKAVRKRVWAAPDYQDISKEEFAKLFPHEAYDDKVADYKNWERKTLVFEQNFDTQKSKEIILKNLKKWNSGYYVLVMEAKDDWQQLVKEEQFFELYSDQDKTLADFKLFDIRMDKNSYQPEEMAELHVGSASTDMMVFVSIEKDHKIYKTHVIHLNNEIKSIKIPVSEADRGGFGITYYYVNYNSFNKGSLLVNVPHEPHHLTIETQTFRDKLQPGAEQTWSFTIKGDQKEKVAAEVLASMYDVSLDEFQPHQWRFHPIQKSSYYLRGSNVDGYKSFQESNFQILNRRYHGGYNDVDYRLSSIATLNWFGFSFTDDYWVKKRYLNTLKYLVENSSYDASLPKKIIAGKVIDGGNNTPMPFVNVYVEGTKRATTTDEKGNFKLKVRKTDEVRVEFTGYETKTFKIAKNKNRFTVFLEPDSEGLDEVVVVGYGKVKKRELTGAITKVSAIEVDDMVLSESSVSSALQGKVAGVAVVESEKENQQAEIDLSQIKARSNLNETAFFLPHLRTDEKGNISFEFTMPEALTRWKLQLLAHSKNLKTATKSLTTVTQKELMVIPNAPRFLREGDQITISSKIASLSEEQLSGVAQLHLTDAITGKDINALLQNNIKKQNFTVAAKGNTQVSWQIKIPENVQAVQYKVVAKAGSYSDGEQNVLPVLSNRMLVTETIPMWIRSNQTKTFTLDKLKESKAGGTLKNHQLTLEMTSNPAWYAIQALPYLMEYPYECAEQTFSRFYANALASHIVQSNPKIKTVFEQWQNTDALMSNLEKNQELKSILIQETPWLRDAQSETEQKKRIALLFDLHKLDKNLNSAINKLDKMQRRDGAFSWFKGARYPNRYITQHIIQGFGHLQKLGVDTKDKKIQKIINKAVPFLDQTLIDDYEYLLEIAAKIKRKAKTLKQGEIDAKAYLAQNHLGTTQLNYLYTRTFFNHAKSSALQKAMDYYNKQAIQYWQDYKLYDKGLIALIQHRNENSDLAKTILKTLKENSIVSDEMGMYWKNNTSGWCWYQAPIVTQSLLIEAFSEIENDIETIDNLKVWLLKNKQTNQWKTTKATTEAVYALLLQGNDWLSVEEAVEVTVGNQKITQEVLKEVKVEAGTGYYKKVWKSDEITPDMATVTLSKKDRGIAWGGLYWQYFEDLDKITAAKTPLQLRKKLFVKTNTDTGKQLSEIKENTVLKVGDLITVRIELQSDRDMEFIHLKDMRASGVEPINVISRYKWQDGLGYYESTKDASTNFFFDRLVKGVYVFEYDVRVNNAGNFSNGISTIQSMYAPEFSSHSEGVRIEVKK